MTTEAAEKRPRVLLVVRSIVLNSEDKILLIRRDKDAERWAPGFWEIPGGKLDEGKDLTHAMQDEVLEETGLVVTPLSKMSYVESETVSQGKYAGLPYVLIVGVSRLLAGELKLSEEHDAAEWMSYNDALGYNLKHDVKRALIALRGQLSR